MSAQGIKAQSRSARARARARNKEKLDSETSESEEYSGATFDIFGYKLGSKIDDWKNAEQETDRPKNYMSNTVEYYKIKGLNLPSILKDFDHTILVEKDSRLVYNVLFTKSEPDYTRTQLEGDRINLLVALNNKYDTIQGDGVVDLSNRTIKYDSKNSDIEISLFDFKSIVKDRRYHIGLVYKIVSISKRVEIKANSDFRKSVDDDSKALP